MTTNNNPGCLASLFRLFGKTPNPARAPLSTQKEKPATISLLKDDEVLASDEAEVPVVNLPYRVRDDFLSPTELSFYHVLRTVTGNRAIICPKVGLADIFFVSRPNENQGYRSRIVQKHLDFLLCDSKTMHPILGIELDDASHNRPDRQVRDEFVNKTFEVANLPLLHFPARRSYNTRELAEALEKHLGPLPAPFAVAEPVQVLPQPEISPSVPLCPKCGVLMVVRTVAKGPHQGKQFYGCVNYPRCREMLPLKK